jgi:Neurotransmitter-gated ion-channel ligand binding domain
MTVFLRQYWRDDRLAFATMISAPFLVLHADAIDNLWLPDTFFLNFKAGYLHAITGQNRIANISSDGSIFYSQRLTVQLACPMNLRRFPMDNQTCHIDLSSCKYSERQCIVLFECCSSLQLSDVVLRYVKDLCFSHSAVDLLSLCKTIVYNFSPHIFAFISQHVNFGTEIRCYRS